MRRTTRRLACLTFLLAGCTVLEKELDAPLEPERIVLEEGETHYRDLLGALGPPARVGTLGDGVGFLYEHLTIREVQVGVGFLSWFKFAPGWASGRREALVLVFDASGVLRGHALYGERERFGSGVAVQWKITAASAVDTADVEAAADTNSWGMRLLRPLTLTLNSAGSLEAGQGLEQRGQFDAAGQKTLELR